MRPQLTKKDLDPTQQAAITHLYEHDASILVAPTGEGKTVICLTAVAELLSAKELKRVIVACPPKVLPRWPEEQAKWKQLQGLNVTLLYGHPDKRKGRMELNPDAHVWVISLNNLEWLLNQNHGADGIIIDELSKAAGKQTQKLKNKKHSECFKWRVGMTATPVSQDFEKLQPMCRIIDNGVALGRNKQNYLEKYFISDYLGYNWELREGAAEQIMQRVAPMVFLIEDTKAQKLPALTEHILRFDMPLATREIYNKMKKDMVHGDVEAVNEAVKSGKLLQLASGFMYGKIEETGEEFIEPYDEMRGFQLGAWAVRQYGRRAVIYYEFEEHWQHIQDSLCHYVITQDNEQFKADHNFQFLVAQINSLSHGVDGLQAPEVNCSTVMFYHPFWSRDATEQAYGRVWRRGQTQPVDVWTLVCNHTLDDVALMRVDDRGEYMKMFEAHLKEEN